MLRPSVVRAAALALLLAGTSPPLALAAGQHPPRAVLSSPSTFKQIWSYLLRFVTLSGQEMDPDGHQSATPNSGQGMDPNG
jgi:hypothetical protein